MAQSVVTHKSHFIEQMIKEGNILMSQSQERRAAHLDFTLYSTQPTSNCDLKHTEKMSADRDLRLNDRNQLQTPSWSSEVWLSALLPLTVAKTQG